MSYQKLGGVYLFLTLWILPFATAEEVYLQPEDFVSEAFDQNPPPPAALWLDATLKEQAARILDHPYRSIRVRYWARADRSAWILEEIGKVKPITIGFVGEDDRIQTAKVLIYRESIGWEIRHPFFTDQFNQVGMDDQLKLDRTIDGISGATMSVSAMEKLSRLALLFARNLPEHGDQNP